MKTNIFAHTESGHAPGFVSINRLDNGDVEVSVRASPTKRRGVRVCGQTCHPRGEGCNNYCNADTSKPMESAPLPFEYTDFGATVSFVVPKDSWPAAAALATESEGK